MAIVAGQIIRASDLNGLSGLGSVLSVDSAAVISSTALVSSSLVIALAANATYAFNGYIRYQASAAADCKLGLLFPAGSTGQWACFAQDPANIPVTSLPRINYTDFDSEPIGNTITCGGDDASLTGAPYLASRPTGYITTSVTAGNLTVQYAQGTSNANNNILKVGSWLIAQRLA